MLKPFFIVAARNKNHVREKIMELKKLGYPYIVVCGEKVNFENVVYREKQGKWDAINYGSRFIHSDANLVILNDVDTKICNLEYALSYVKDYDIVYCRVCVPIGPQVKFYRILDPLRKKLHVTASGELMLIKKHAFTRLLPIPPCIAEDSYLLFKAMEQRFSIFFCTKTFVRTFRTCNVRQEESYKTRTTLGIYQALCYSKPTPLIRIFYLFLPFFCPLLLLFGEDGKAYSKGIFSALKLYIRKERPTRF